MKLTLSESGNLFRSLALIDWVIARVQETTTPFQNTSKLISRSHSFPSRRPRDKILKRPLTVRAQQHYCLFWLKMRVDPGAK